MVVCIDCLFHFCGSFMMPLSDITPVKDEKKMETSESEP